MNDYIISQLVACCLFLIVGVFLAWRYRATVSRPAITRSLQYRLFAIRDAVVSLVADGRCTEDNPDFQQLYTVVNLTAHAAHVQAIQGGRFMVTKMLQEVPAPTEEEVEEFRRKPDCIRDLWYKYVLVVFSVYVEGSSILNASFRKKHIMRLFQKLNPPEEKKFKRWEETFRRVESYRSGNRNNGAPAAAAV